MALNPEAETPKDTSSVELSTGFTYRPVSEVPDYRLQGEYAQMVVDGIEQSKRMHRQPEGFYAILQGASQETRGEQ